MATKRVWLTFDLGVTGDYDHLYQWLDEHNAVECGNGVATFEYDFKQDSEDLPTLLEQLKTDLSKFIAVDSPRTKVYALTLPDGAPRPGGMFIFGSRKANPWDGYASKGPVIDA